MIDASLFKFIGKRLHEVRVDLELSQKELAAELSNYAKLNKLKLKEKECISFTQVDISNVERSKSIIKEKVYIILAFYRNKYKVDLNYLFCNSPSSKMYTYEKVLT